MDSNKNSIHKCFSAACEEECHSLRRCMWLCLDRTTSWRWIKPRGVLNWPREGPFTDHQLQTCGQTFILNHTQPLRYLSQTPGVNSSSNSIPLDICSLFLWKCFKDPPFFLLTVLSSPLGVRWLPIPHDRWFHQNQRNSLKRKGRNC